jgi:hypothetical protein
LYSVAVPAVDAEAAVGAVNRVAQIDLVVYPALDAVFSEAVIRAVLADELEHGRPAADRVETCLRATFARVVVRPREALATYDEGAALWYAYRDGRFSPYHGDAHRPFSADAAGDPRR